MVRVKGTLLALVLLFLATPALAAVDRFTDEKGVIHITNGKAAKPSGHENSQTHTPAPVEPPPPETPEAPPAKEEAAPPVGPENRNEAAKPSSYLTVRQGVIRITNVADRDETLARRPQVPESKETPQNVTTSGHRPAIAPVAWAEAPAPAAAKPVPASVRAFKDRQGVIHITNAPPSRPAPRDFLLAARPVAAGPETRHGSQSHTRGIFPIPYPQAPAFPVKPASFAGSAPGFDSAPVASAPETSSGRTLTTVRRFRDAKGVIHLVSTGPPGRPPSPVEARGPTPSAGLPPGTHANRLYPGNGTYGLPHQTVSVRRDKQGRLLIRSAPPEPPMRFRQEDLPPELAPVVAEAALLYGLPVSLIEAVIKVESNFQCRAVSPKGAMGLMQLMPGTARFLQVSDPFCPRENVLAGSRYLRLLLDFFGQNLPLALAAYNAGYQRVLDAGLRVPDIEETRNFVTQVLARYYLREKQRQYRSSLL